MAKIDRYNGNLLPFAQNFTGGNRTIFGETIQSNDLTDNINAKFLQGWEATTDANTFPTKQDFNAVAYVSTALAGYLHQIGIPEWNEYQEYHENSFTNFNGVLYRCKTNDHTSVTDPANDTVNWEDVLGNFVSKTGDETIGDIKTFTSSPIVPTPTTNFQVATKEYVDNNIVPELIWIKPLSRHNKPLFTKVNPHSISIPSGFKVAVNNKVINVTSDYILSLDSNLDTGTKTAGTDYYVYAKDDETFYLSANNAITVDKLIGGFHYGLTGEIEAPTGNKSENDMVKIRGINEYSIWDLTWLPVNGDARGMHYKFGIWVDIYQTDEDYALRGYSSCFALDGITPAKIAGGTTENGRGIPKIPLVFGGDGTLTYGKYTWFQASEVGKAFNKRLLRYEEFIAFAYGVDEGKSSQTNGYETIAGRIEHYPNLTSSTGMEQATGVQWVWGADFGVSTSGSWNNISDGRGQVNTNANPVLLGGNRGDAGYAGSRCSLWSYSLSYSSWSFGSRFACDHLMLD